MTERSGTNEVSQPFFKPEEFCFDVIHEGNLCDPSPQELCDMANKRVAPLLEELAKVKRIRNTALSARANVLKRFGHEQ